LEALEISNFQNSPFSTPPSPFNHVLGLLLPTLTFIGIFKDCIASLSASGSLSLLRIASSSLILASEQGF
jgi:hypothetical protein